MSATGGFEVLAMVAISNTQAAELEMCSWLDRPTREGIDIDLWRALPDSDAGQPP